MTIRAKLTLLNAGVIAILTSLLGIIIFVTTSADLQSSIDRELLTRAQMAQRIFGRATYVPNTGAPEPGVNDLTREELASITLRQPRIFDDSELDDPRMQHWDKQALEEVRRTGKTLKTTLKLPSEDGSRTESIRVLTMRIQAAKGKASCLQIAASLAAVQEETTRLAERLLILVPLSWLAAGLAGWLLTYLALRPVRRLAQDSQALLEGDPGLRLPSSDPDEMGQLARVINQGLEKIELGYRRLERFAGDASHELKSPLTAIMIRASSAPKDNPEAMSANLDAIRESARGMSGMINDLLLAAKIGEGREHPSATAKLDEAVHEVVKSVPPSEVNRVLLGEIAPLEVVGEPLLVQRIIANLVFNSLKHGGSHAMVRIAVVEEKGKAKITVADTGAGIDPEEMPYIFERFYRGDSARTHGEEWKGEGSGLGLAIVKSLTERMQGTISCKSQVGEGTTMIVQLPIFEKKTHPSQSQKI